MLQEYSSIWNAKLKEIHPNKALSTKNKSISNTLELKLCSYCLWGCNLPRVKLLHEGLAQKNTNRRPQTTWNKMPMGQEAPIVQHLKSIAQVWPRVSSWRQGAVCHDRGILFSFLQSSIIWRTTKPYDINTKSATHQSQQGELRVYIQTHNIQINNQGNENWNNEVLVIL